MTHRNGCFDRAPYATTQKLQNGYFDDGFERTGKLESWPFVMARDCQYTHSALGMADKGCTGCQHSKTEMTTKGVA